RRSLRIARRMRTRRRTRSPEATMAAPRATRTRSSTVSIIGRGSRPTGDIEGSPREAIFGDLDPGRQEPGQEGRHDAEGVELADGLVVAHPRLAELEEVADDEPAVAVAHQLGDAHHAT